MVTMRLVGQGEVHGGASSPGVESRGRKEPGLPRQEVRVFGQRHDFGRMGPDFLLAEPDGRGSAGEWSGGIRPDQR